MTFNQSGICKKIEVRSFSAYIVHALQVKHVFLLFFFSIFSSHFSFVSIFACSLRILQRRMKCLFQTSPKKIDANIFEIFRFISIAKKIFKLAVGCWYSLFGLTLITIGVWFFNDTFWAHIDRYWT